ncbi:MAG: putative lipid II flippase FtsW [Rhodospirillaceae bacterium]|nr:putative lipid II flippase FtsW [Rhodospirillaceae bacterium]
MSSFARTDTSTLARWWWTVDRWSLTALALLVGLGIVLTVAASPPVAHRLGYGEYHFVARHLAFIIPAVGILFATSLLDPERVRRLSLFVLAAGLLGILATLVVGAEVKGAQRWINLGPLSIQPSEFVKPAFAVIAAWLFAQQRLRHNFPGYNAAIALYAVVVLLLLAQPDLGMAVLVSALWGVEFFLAGLPLVLVLALATLAVGGMIGSYFLFDHVASRIDRFLDPSSGDSYQIDRSLEAFANGGIWGTGPGEGTVKLHLPDAHADFIFAVAGEELGLLWCLALLALFAFIVLRGLARAMADDDLFVVLAVAGLLTLFGAQGLINMASALHLIPTKGMTLPFVSYGGSSMLAMGLGMGMVLALTRRRPSMRWSR